MWSLQEEIEEVIVSVPAYFHDKQRLATKRAGALAGIRVDRLYNEPSAASMASYMDKESWLVDNGDNTYIVTDLAGFVNGTGLARGKNIPGFDTFGRTAENDAFGTNTERAVHFSASVAEVLEENYEYYSTIDGFENCDVDDYIAEASRTDIIEQTYLMNATHILIDEVSEPAVHWRTRNGTADQHTSFAIAYDLCMAAFSNEDVESVDYSLVWNMGHGSNEGTTTGSFASWINGICQ